MKTKYEYEVIEDNGGGLSLYIFDGEKVIYSHSGYEYNPGQLTTDLNELDTGTDISDWEGCEETPQANYDQFDNYEYGWAVVARGAGGDRKLYPSRMGRAAQAEFGIEAE